MIAQALGLLSFALGISTFYQKEDKKLKILMLIFNLNHLLHYLLLGSLVSALGALLSAIRTATAIHCSSKIFAMVFIAISVLSGLCLAQGVWQLWPIVGTVIGTYSVFMLQGIRLRIGFLLGASCWLINNIYVGSVGGTLLEISAMVMNCTTIFRLYRAQQSNIAIN